MTIKFLISNNLYKFNIVDSSSNKNKVVLYCINNFKTEDKYGVYVKNFDRFKLNTKSYYLDNGDDKELLYIYKDSLNKDEVLELSNRINKYFSGEDILIESNKEGLIKDINSGIFLEELNSKLTMEVSYLNN